MTQSESRVKRARPNLSIDTGRGERLRFRDSRTGKGGNVFQRKEPRSQRPRAVSLSSTQRRTAWKKIAARRPDETRQKSPEAAPLFSRPHSFGLTVAGRRRCCRGRPTVRQQTILYRISPVPCSAGEAYNSSRVGHNKEPAACVAGEYTEEGGAASPTGRGLNSSAAEILPFKNTGVPKALATNNGGEAARPVL